jgi:phage baseplate assembly protein W
MSSYNIKFPSEDDNSSGSFYLMNETTNEGLISNLYFLLLTKKGERYYMPEFGTNLQKYIFEPNDDLTITDIEKSIKEDVAKFIPELEITTIKFNNDDDNKNEYKLIIQVGFRFIESTSAEDGKLEIKV